MWDKMKLDDPLKIEWRSRTLARSKIHDLNQDLDSEESALVDDVLSREKTNAVIQSVEEAEALATELSGYIGEAGQGGRVWVNSSVDKSCRRIQRAIIEGMESRGFETNRPGGRGTVVRFEPGVGAEAGVPLDDEEGGAGAGDDSEDDEERIPDRELVSVDPEEVTPGDLVRTTNDSVYRVVSRPREEGDTITVRVVDASGAGRTENIFLADVVRRVGPEEEDEIHSDPPEEPAGVSEADVEEAVREAQESGVPLDDVLPRGASTHLKTINGNKYAYVNWREGGEHKSKYLGRGADYGLV